MSTWLYTSQKTEVDMGRARQQDTRKPMDTALPPGNRRKGTPRGRPTRRWRDELDDYWMGTIWQRIAQDGQMWMQHVDVIATPPDNMAAQ